MEITNHSSDEAALLELGRRLKRARLDRNLTQEQLAAEAGVSRQTVVRLEAGGAARLPAFVGVLRALGMLGALGSAIPEPLPSPIEQLEMQGRRRQRARRRSHDDSTKDGSWTWGTP